MSDNVKKMTIGHELVLNQALDAIDKKENGTPRKLPFKVRARISRMKDLMSKDLQMYEEERQRLVREFGEEVTTEDGNTSITVAKEKLPEFYSKVDEVLQTEVDPGWKKFTKDEIALIDDLEIEISDAQLATFFAFCVEDNVLE